MVYIKLEDNMDKFMCKYQKFPRVFKNILFQSKCRNGKFELQKIDGLDYIILPRLNENIFKKLKILFKVRCWKNICASDNLMREDKFLQFAEENDFFIVNGKWLFEHMITNVIDYIETMEKKNFAKQEVLVLCNHLDEIISENIEKIAVKFKICNIVTKNTNQFRKLENELFQNNGIVLNVVANPKKVFEKSDLIINFDFSGKELQRYVLPPKVSIINIDKNNKINRRCIDFYEIEMPTKYLKYKEIFEGFNTNNLYESFIYKKTNYKNIKKEIEQDDVKIAYLQDSEQKIMRKSNKDLSKKLEKMVTIHN